jgi:hypothetical protein
MSSDPERNEKGHGTSIRRHTMTSILKRDDQMVIPPSRSLVHVVSAVAERWLERNSSFLMKKGGRVRRANSPATGFLWPLPGCTPLSTSRLVSGKDRVVLGHQLRVCGGRVARGAAAWGGPGRRTALGHSVAARPPRYRGYTLSGRRCSQPRRAEVLFASCAAGGSGGGGGGAGSTDGSGCAGAGSTGAAGSG